ncbi:MAG: zinc ribbon domain-containing protein [Candidatus Aminicenantes bacterium]|nr:zinc ribbon domain-containing protein [Candidatus Aminicenantes bacterium]
MLKKLKALMLSGSDLADHYEKSGDLNKAYKEYTKQNNYKKAAKVLEKMSDWHSAANIYIENNEIDLARRAIENCFNRGKSWESFEPSNGKKVTIEEWLKDHNQTQRFVRYVHNTKKLSPNGIPLIIVLAEKLEKIEEYKNAAQLYNNGYFLVNKNILSKKLIRHEEWLLKAAECYSKIGKYDEAAQCLKELIVTEVEIGSEFSGGYKVNPYRNYKVMLEKAREYKTLPELLDLLEDFDPFNVSYNLLKMNEVELSKAHFFKYFGRVVKKNLTEQEREVRNEKISYCLNQYIIYHRERKEYLMAAEIALLNSQKKIASELYKLASAAHEVGKQEEISLKNIKMKAEKSAQKPTEKKSEPDVELKCHHCGEKVEVGWDLCPNCENALMFDMCHCGEKIQPHWKVCPACGKHLG